MPIPTDSSLPTVHIVQILVREQRGTKVVFLLHPHETWRPAPGAEPFLVLPTKKTIGDIAEPFRRGTAIEHFVDAVMRGDLGFAEDDYALEEEISAAEEVIPAVHSGVRKHFVVFPVDVWVAPARRETVRGQLGGLWLTPDEAIVHPRISPTAREVMKHILAREAALAARNEKDPKEETRDETPNRMLLRVPDRPSMYALASKWFAKNKGGVRHLPARVIDDVLAAGDRAFNLRVVDPYLRYQRQGIGFTWSFFTHKDAQDIHVHSAPTVEIYGVIEGTLEIWWKPYHDQGTSAWNRQLLGPGDWIEVEALQCHVVRWHGEGKGVVFKAGPGPLAGVGRLGVSGKTKCDECICMKPQEVCALAKRQHRLHGQTCQTCQSLLAAMGSARLKEGMPAEEKSQAHGPSNEDRRLRLFLSYGHDANEELVRLIKADLERRGHDVWFDKSDIKAGDDWRRSITEGITNSHKFVSFLSKHSTRDPGVCLDEIAIAIGVKGGNIQTILVEGEQEVKPPPTVNHIQWLDMHDWKERKERSSGVPPEHPDSWEQWYQSKLAEIVRVLESDKSRRFAGEIQTLAEHLKPIASDSRIATLLRKGFIGRKWMSEAIEQWRNATDRASRLFWITGDPGVGKSAFAAHLTHFGRDKVIAAQFVEWDKPDHRHTARVVRSLAFQLATRLPDYRKLLLTLPEIAELDRKDPAELFDYLLANPLRSVIGGGRERQLIVIDALDEAGSASAQGEAGRNPLVEMLARHAPRLPDWLGLIVTSRPESAVQTPLQGLNPFVLDTRTEANRADLRDYLRQKLAPQLHARPDADRLLGQILEKSEGVFLYVERFCDDVQQNHLSLDRPEQFPQGLGGIFCQWFQRQFPDLEKFRQHVRPALRAILAAREPLPVEILQRLFHWQDEELRDFTHTLGSLFPVTKEANGEVIKPYHKSLADWMADKGKAGAYFTSEVEGHRLLSDYGWSEFERCQHFLSPFFLSNLPYHLLQTGRGKDFSKFLTSAEYCAVLRGMGRIGDLLSACDHALREESDFPASQKRFVSSWRDWTPEEVLAKHIHERLVHEFGATTSDPKSRTESWKALNEGRRTGIRQRASAILWILQGNGFLMHKIPPSKRELLVFSEDELHRLASSEHELWRRERQDDGWRWGKVKCKETREHPLLLPYSELDCVQRLRIQEECKLWPALFASIGYELCRADTATRVETKLRTPSIAFGIDLGTPGNVSWLQRCEARMDLQTPMESVVFLTKDSKVMVGIEKATNDKRRRKRKNKVDSRKSRKNRP